MPPLPARWIRSCLLPMLIGLLAACGGGGGGGGGGGSILSDQAPPPRTAAPVFKRDSTLHVGTQASPGRGRLTEAGSRNGISLYAGPLPDGTSEADILVMLGQITPSGPGQVTPSTDDIFPITFRTSPTVRVVRGAPEEFRGVVREAVAILNSILPANQQMRFDATPVERPASLDAIPEGQIHVEFSDPGVDASGWRHVIPDLDVPSNGLAFRRLRHDCINSDCVDSTGKPVYPANNWTEAGWVGINSASEIHRADCDREECRNIPGGYDHLNVLRHGLVHELLHNLGLWGHVTDPDSVLSSNANFGNAKRGETFVLSAKDKDLIHAVFTRVKHNANPASAITNLGPWSRTSTHRMGMFATGGGTVAFGVWNRNGLIQPWAQGPAPDPTDTLRDADFDAGTAHWDGVFLGYASTGTTVTAVTGDVRLSVTLADLTAGTLAFSDLEQAGGTRWGDGDLDYRVTIADGRFDNQDRTGPDAGVITGVFLGTDHKAMAGTLRRDDLAGAFGGKN